MGLCLILLGYFIGSAIYPEADGAIAGIFIAAFIWLIMSLISYFSGSSIILALSRAKEVTHDIHPQLFNIVEEMKIASSLPVIPKVYIIDDPAMNAFATGIKPEKSAVAVTAGLLSRLNRDELQGVIAHEMSHIVNRDVLYMTMAGVLLGSIVLISEIFLRGMFYSGGSSRRYRSSSKAGTGGQAQVIFLIIAVVFAVLAPIIVHLLYFAISRKREYLADASAVRLTRYPEGLASALEKISASKFDLASANKATAPMYIVNPLKKSGMKIQDISSTHPPISERIRILRGMMQGAGYINYQKAFSNIRGSSSFIIPHSGLNLKEDVPIRHASGESEIIMDKKKTARELGDLMMAVNKFAFLVCLCGLNIKLPPDFNKQDISCPRCGRKVEVPLAEKRLK